MYSSSMAHPSPRRAKKSDPDNPCAFLARVGLSGGRDAARKPVAVATKIFLTWIRRSSSDQVTETGIDSNELASIGG